MNIASYVFYKKNEEVLNKTNEFLINKLKNKKSELVTKLGEILIEDYITEDEILNYRLKLQEINKLIDIMECSPENLILIDFNRYLNVLGRNFHTELKDIKIEIDKLL